MSEFSRAAPTGPSAVVASVYDGDTLTLTSGERVRLLQIDTPELGSGECYSRAARTALRQRARIGSRVQLEADPALDKVDRYGRLLRYVHRRTMNVNVALVRAGAAAPYFYGGDRGKYANRLMAEAIAAKAVKRGLWGACRGTRLDPYRAGVVYRMDVRDNEDVPDSADVPASRPSGTTRFLLIAALIVCAVGIMVVGFLGLPLIVLALVCTVLVVTALCFLGGILSVPAWIALLTVVRSPLFWAPVVVAGLVYFAALSRGVYSLFGGRYTEPIWPAIAFVTPVTVGAAALVRALLRRHPASGQLALMGLTLVLLYLVLGTYTTPRYLFSDAASSVSGAPGP